MSTPMNEIFSLIDRLSEFHSLSVNEYRKLLSAHCDEVREYARQKALVLRKKFTATTYIFADLSR